MDKNNYCDDCQFLNVTEDMQRYLGNKFNHVCLLTGQQIMHGISHPNLERLECCKKTHLKETVINFVRQTLNEGKQTFSAYGGSLEIEKLNIKNQLKNNKDLYPLQHCKNDNVGIFCSGEDCNQCGRYNK